MTKRPVSRRRPAARSARHASKRSPWLGLGLIAASLAAGAGLALAPLFAARVPLDPATGCRTDADPPSHTVLLIDASEPLAARHKRLLSAAAARIQRDTERHGQVSIVLLRADAPQEPLWLESLCSPGDGQDANPLFANPAHQQARWAEGFAEPLAAAAQTAGERRADRASPISAGLKAVSADARFMDADDRSIVLVSDMIEFDPSGANLYDPARAFDPARDRTALLNGVHVRVVWLDRPDIEAVQSGVWTRFWRAWFAASGATVDQTAEPRPLSSEP